MWQVASGGVSCTVISVTVVLAAFVPVVVAVVVAVALALLGNLSTHSDTHPAPPATPRPRLYWSPLSHTATLGQIGDLLHCYFVVDVARFAAALFIYCLGDLNDSTDSAFAEVC